MEELGSILPNTGIFIVLELEVRGQQVSGEAVAALPWQEGGEMVNADDIDETLMARLMDKEDQQDKRTAKENIKVTNIPVILGNANGGVLEGGGGVIDRQGVVRVGDVAADVGDDGNLATLGQALRVQKGRNGLHEIDAVHEDVRVQNLGEGASLGGLCHVPANDILTVLTNKGGVRMKARPKEKKVIFSRRNSSGEGKVDGTRAAPSKCSHDVNARVLGVA